MNDHPAAFIVHTPTGHVPCCPRHAAALEGLLAFMGCATNRTVAPEGAVCGNCVTEAKRRDS